MPLQNQSKGIPPPVPSVPPSIGILVASCDKYADLWPVFFELFRKFWPDCPYPVYLLTNHLRPDHRGVVSIPVGADTSWSGNLRAALRAIPEEHVLMLLDDLFLLAPVRNQEVSEICREFISARGNCLKLNPTVPGDRRFSPQLDLSSRGAAYRASTVLTLWKKELLHDLLVEGESAWDFEIEGSKRSDAHDGFFVSRQGQFQLVNGVIKGRWSRRALRQVSACTASPIQSSRAVFTPGRELLYQLALLRSRLLYRIPGGRPVFDALRRLRGKLMNLFLPSRR